MNDDWLLDVARAVADAVDAPSGQSDPPREAEDEQRADPGRRIDELRSSDAETAAAMEQILRIACSHQTLTEAETLAMPRPSRQPRVHPAEGDSWGHLRIGAKLGEGAHGVVYSARDSVLDRPVALKLVPSSGDVSESGLPREVVEGRLLARVSHPNVVTVFGADELAGLIGIWMEYVQGSSLTEVVEQQGPLSEREAALIGIEVARAAAALHQRGIVHRDIKAQNVMRERGGRIVLMDLGVSLESRRAEPGAPVRGTPLYLAPELLDGAEASPRTDVYSLGVLLFFLCTRRYPVEGANWHELRSKHKAQQRLHLTDARPNVDRRFAAILNRAIAPKPGERFQTMGELEDALSGYLVDVGPGGGAEASTGPPATGGRRAAPLAAMALVMLALTAAMLWIVLSQESPAGPSSRVVVVADVDNRTDDAALDEAIEELLDLALVESRGLEPIAASAREAALQRMQHQESELSLERAAEMVRREAFLAALGGSVAPAAGGIEVRLIASSLSGQRHERMFTASRDELIATLGEHIGPLLAEISDSASSVGDLLPLEKATTESLEALERFSEAQLLHREGSYDEAMALLETAVEIDPGFAMAWNRLADYQSGAGRHAASVESSAKAYGLREETTERERRYIQALYHRIRLQHYQAALEFERLAALGSPGLASAYHQIALAFEWVPDSNRATRFARLAAQADPENPIHRGMYALFEAKRGNTQQALELVRRARRELEAPEKTYLYWAEGIAHQMAGDLDSAIAAFTVMADSGTAVYVRFGRSLRAQAHVETGNPEAALVDLELLATDAELARDDHATFVSELWSARIEHDRGRSQRLLDAARWTPDLLDPDTPRTLERGRHIAASLARVGLEAQLIEIRALLAPLSERFPSGLSRAAVDQLDGTLALLRGDPDLADEHAVRALREHRDHLSLQLAAATAAARGEKEREVQLLTELVEQRKGEILTFGFVGDWLAARNRLEEVRLAQ